MKRTCYCFLTCLIILAGLPASSQAVATPMFVTINLPRSLGSVENLNLEIAKMTDQDKVRQVLKTKNFPAGDIIIQIKRSPKKLVWWTINTGTWVEWEDERIIFQSRGTTLANVNRLADFKMIFKDTVILLDTLAIGIYVHDANYPDQAFRLSYNCKNDTVKVLLATENKLLLTNSLFESCDRTLFTVKITNEGNPDRIFATCFLGFTTVEQREALLNLGQAYHNQNPEKDAGEVAEFLADYFRRSGSGTINYSQLVDWLNANLKP